MILDWQQHPSWGRGPALRLTVDGDPCERLVVVSAHPDDEALGVGGLVALAHRAGVPVYLVLLTAGEASHPPREHMTRHALASQRLAEMDAAVDVLAPGSPVVFLGALDGGVAAVEDEVTTALTEVLGDAGRTILLAPWRHDGHPDHDAAGRAAARAAAATGARLVEYPLVMWRHRTPDDVPWEHVAVVHLDEATLETKLTAIRAHASQLRTESGDGPPLDGRLLAHATVPVEHVLLTPADVPAPRAVPAAAADRCEVSR